MTNTSMGSGNPAATGVAGRASLLRFRHAFLGTVAAGALSLAGSPALANDPCVLSAGNTIETCTGNQSGGVPNPVPTVTTLNVNNLTQAIAPASGTNGITFTSAGAVTINSDTGTFGIAAVNAEGIYAHNTGAAAVTVTSSGNITTTGNNTDAIFARTDGAGAATVTSTGNITAAGAGTIGIYALTQAAGAITVTSTGNIAANSGIYAGSIGAAMTVTSTGNITAGGFGILASGTNGDLTVTSTGNITTAATGEGILVGHIGTGAVTVSSTGDITTTGASQAIAIFIHNFGPGAVTLTSAGNLTTTADDSFGIYIRSTSVITATSTGNVATSGDRATAINLISNSDAATVTSTGNITTKGLQAAGISVSSAGSGAATVTSTGNISTTGDRAPGIFADTVGNGAVAVSSIGNITTTGGGGSIGIYAYGRNGSVTVTSKGNISSTGSNGVGIAAASHAGAITVTSTGDITTAGIAARGISAESLGAAAITVTSTGNITTAGVGAQAIYAVSTGAVTVTSTGNLTTAADVGIDAVSTSGAVTVTSAGNISTKTDDAVGILAYNTSAAAIKVTSTGNLTTTGVHAYGVFAKSVGGGAITVASTGNITTAGDSASGISAIGSSAITVTSTGDITTAGVGARGISAASAGTGAVTVTSVGNVTTAGVGAQAIYAISAGAVTVTSTGNLTTATDVGIDAVSTSGAVTVTSAGNISTKTDNAVGILAYNTGAAAIKVTSTGNITTTGVHAYGVFAKSVGGGAITVASTGNITTAGNSASGISAIGSGGITVTSAGNITTRGANAYGIVGFNFPNGPIAVTITSGTVSGGSGAGAGIFLSGGSTNTLTNMGTLTALSSLAIKGDTGNNTVNNSGTVIGNVILGTGANAFNNMAGGFFNSGVTVNLGAGNLLTNAGTLSPGGAGVIQTTALTGNLTQTATGTLFTDINIAGATSDRVNVSGKANLAGAVQVAVLNPTTVAFQQTVLSAAGGTTNNGLTLLASPALQAQLVFPNATDVVVKSAGINFVVPGLNMNQNAVSTTLNGALQSGTPGGGPIFNVLLNGPTTLAGFGAVLTQLSGEAATGTQQTTFDAMNSFMGTMLDPFNRGPGLASGPSVSGYAAEGASAYASDGRKRTGAERDAYAMVTKAPPQTFEARWNVWAAGFGGSQTTDGNVVTGSNSVTSRIAGGAVGADYLLSPNTIAGFALAGGGTSFSLANNLGTGRSDLFQAGVYARHTFGAAYISGALAYGWQDITTDRTLTLAGIDHLQARFNANAFSGRVEGGYRFMSPWMGVGITPYAAGQFTTFDLPAYAEHALVGTNAFALAYGAKSVTDPRSELGIRTDKSFAMQDGVVTLRGRVAWAHDYDPSRAIGATFQALPGASFVVNGAAQASDSALVTASIEKRWLNGWSAAATFEGEFSNVTTSYAGKGTVRYTW